MRESLPCCQESQPSQPSILINFSSPKNPMVFLGVCSQQDHGLPLLPFSLGGPQSISLPPHPSGHVQLQLPWTLGTAQPQGGSWWLTGR